MRRSFVSCVLVLGCAKGDPPTQDPLDYLRVGVDPRDEAAAIVEDLARNGFQLGRRIDEPGYVAFDATSGPESTVRVVSSRGVVLSLEAPDVRWPERLSVALAPDPRPDFDADGQGDVIVSMQERNRTCLAWAQVDARGFALEVFRPRNEWGEAPCVLEIDAAGARLLLEVTVPGAKRLGARVQLPIRARARGWVLDDSVEGNVQWDRAAAERGAALEQSVSQGDQAAADRLRAELAWLEQLRNAEDPVLEPANDGQDAR